mmetsp:Transcript_1584/g.2812  ORF Transcript_1584/g.2812 Transcript_1584/m.2812 type:complete len:113 (-) Transcript_1584:161-499(-)
MCSNCLPTPGTPDTTTMHASCEAEVSWETLRATEEASKLPVVEGSAFMPHSTSCGPRHRSAIGHINRLPLKTKMAVPAVVPNNVRLAVRLVADAAAGAAWRPVAEPADVAEL